MSSDSARNSPCKSLSFQRSEKDNKGMSELNGDLGLSYKGADISSLRMDGKESKETQLFPKIPPASP